FRRPLSRFLQDFGGRITKFSAFHLEFEFAEIAAPSLSIDEFKFSPEDNVTGGVFTTTTIMELLRKIGEASHSDYLMVDIGTGKRWLISRLFLFTLMLSRIGAIRCVVFTETRDNYKRKLLGMATPESVCNKLAEKYQWFATALDQTYLSPADAEAHA